MITSSHKMKSRAQRTLKKLRGATTLVLTSLLLLSATLIVLFAANYSLTQTKVSANMLRSQSAFEAAQAGLEFGIVYLQKNYATILVSKVNGFLSPTYSDSSTNNVALTNGSKYTIVYSNPIQNNYNLIKVTVTGTSDDGTATRIVSQQVEYGSQLASPGTNDLVSKGSLVMSGNTTITNANYGTTIDLGGGMTASGNFQTNPSTGTGSTAGHYGGDIAQNVSTLANMSNSDLFSSIFGITPTQFQAAATHTITNSSNYSSSLNALAGKTGSTIWINQTSGTASFTGNTTVGSAANPVILVVNGNVNISGNFTLYGFMFVIGATAATTNISGNITVTGGFVSTDNINSSGNVTMTYSGAVLNSTQLSTVYFARVPGSWKDF